MTFQPGKRVLVQYQADPSLWHERVLLSRLQGSRYLTLTPALQLADEDLAMGADSKIVGLRSLRPDRTALGIGEDSMYKFEDEQGRDVDGNELDEWIMEATMIASTLGFDTPSTAPLHGNGMDSSLVATGDSIIADALRHESGTKQIGPRESVARVDGTSIVANALAAASGVGWVVSESRGGLRANDPLPPSAKAVRGEQKGYIILDLTPPIEVAIHLTGHGGTSFGASNSCTTLSIKAKEVEKTRVDTRVFPLAFNIYGARNLEFKDGVDMMVEWVPDDWPILGPMTVVWLLTFFYRNGGSAMAYHHRWMTEMRLEYSAGGTQEHMAWCKFFDLLISYDMIDACKLASAEIGARKIQMIHERWKHKSPNLATNSDPKGHDDDTHLMFGTYETRGNVGISPLLQKWLGDELGKEASASKERRKAREERAFATKK